MSLIQEALKRKAEDGPAQPANTPPAPPPVAPKRRPQKNPPPTTSTPGPRPVVIFLIPIILVLLAAGGAYFFLTQSKPGKKQAEQKQSPAPVAEPAPAPAPNPLPAAPTPVPAPDPAPNPAVQWPDISFSGTATAKNRALAVINGRMLAIGETIENITVLQIGTNKVLLEYQGEKRLFRLD